jgi:hypothetical protein
MKKILLTIFIAISINSLGQNWTNYQVDSILTLAIPDNYKVTDTLGQRLTTARIDNGLILVSALANEGEIATNIQNEAELIRFYKGFEKGHLNSQHGQAIKDEIVENSGLKMFRFSYKASMNGEVQIRHCLVVFVNEKMYAVNFWEVESMTNDMSATREKLFSSLKFPTNPGLKNQMTNKGDEERKVKQGELIGQITIFGLIIGLAIWRTKRAKKKRVMAPKIKKPGNSYL